MLWNCWNKIFLQNMPMMKIGMVLHVRNAWQEPKIMNICIAWHFKHVYCATCREKIILTWLWALYQVVRIPQLFVYLILVDFKFDGNVPGFASDGGHGFALSSVQYLNGEDGLANFEKLPYRQVVTGDVVGLQLVRSCSKSELSIFVNHTFVHQASVTWVCRVVFCSVHDSQTTSASGAMGMEQ